MPNLRDQFEQNNVTNILQQDIRKAKDRKYYGYTFDQAGRHPISLAIDFMTQNGSRFGIFYMELTSPIKLNLGNGSTGQTIALKTSDMEIVIEGRHLAPVYEYLLEQRLVWVKEADRSFVVEGDETVVEGIKMQT